MNIPRFLFLLALLLIPSSISFAQQLSQDELIEILGIKSWRVPMPKDESMEWSIEIVDYVPRKYVKPNMQRLNPQKKALVALRDTGKDTYAFTLKQTGTGQGELEINICTDAETRDNRCDNSYEVEWFDTPKPYDDGTKFVIADIRQMVGQAPRKQIILEPFQFRLKDMLNQKPRSQ